MIFPITSPAKGKRDKGRERLFIVSYDIADKRRWRRVFRLLQGYGEWLQLSVFQCCLTRRRKSQLVEALSGIIEPGEDHVLIFELGAADGVGEAVAALGRPYLPLERRTVIV